MFLSLTTTGGSELPATDLGFLLHKHPEKAQRFTTAHGVAHVFYPEASPERCTVALVHEVDAVALVRGGRGKGSGARRGAGSTAADLGSYVNDRPYAASSLLAVALRAAFATALQGRCVARPELVERSFPLRIEVPAVAVSGGAELVRRLFAPLGWQVRATAVPLDVEFPEWGDADYVQLVLTGRARLVDALRHLYVLLPVLDGGKHYWVAPDEVEKLLRSGEGWLAGHPEEELIVHRYLARSRALTRDALERLELVRLAVADDTAPEQVDNAVDEFVDTEQAPVPLAARRRAAIVGVLHEVAAARVLDLGCGSGQLLAELLPDARFTELVGVDVSQRALSAAARRLHVDRLSEREAARVRLVQGSLAYSDARWQGYDAAVLSEVVEHVDPPRLPTLAHAVFATARPRSVIVTTPNAEYNVRYAGLGPGQLRHTDHRFEWTRGEFRAWADEVALRYGYEVAFRPVGPDDPEVGAPTQLALFTLRAPGEAPPRTARSTVTGASPTRPTAVPAPLPAASPAADSPKGHRTGAADAATVQASTADAADPPASAADAATARVSVVDAPDHHAPAANPCVPAPSSPAERRGSVPSAGVRPAAVRPTAAHPATVSSYAPRPAAPHLPAPYPPAAHQPAARLAAVRQRGEGDAR